MKLKVGTDFSGIGAPEQALKNLGIDFESVFACEIDKYARQSYSAIHDEPKRFYNDITQRDHTEVEQLDLYVAGFPCQSFSIAGQRKGFDETRGTLFFDVAEFIRINQPKCFILENVKGLLSHDKGRTYQTITDILTNGGGTLNGQISIDLFDDGLGYHCFAQVLNTRDYGVPQNRERIFIVGFKDFREFSFPIKEQLQLKLRDMLQDNPDSKFYLSDKQLQSLTESKHEHASRIHDVEKSSPTIMAKSGGGHEPFIKVCQLNPSKESGGQQPYQQKRIYDCNGLIPALSAGQEVWGGNIINTSKIRRLTPLECWRLQDFPDDAFLKAADVCSDTQLYKQAGNSITVAVIQKIIQKIY
jgi:DNA (cytosine-5)-methyltransferase 1